MNAVGMILQAMEQGIEFDVEAMLDTHDLHKVLVEEEGVGGLDALEECGGDCMRCLGSCCMHTLDEPLPQVLRGGLCVGE